MKTLSVLTSFVSMAAAMCHHGTSLSPRSLDHVKRGDSQFGYQGLAGPLNWHNLAKENSICATGKNQSPIDIQTNKVRGEELVHGSAYNLDIENLPFGAEVENLGTTLQVYTNGSATFQGVEHALKQFHFHTPSEHHIDGRYFDFEVHFVFQAPDKSLSVLAFLGDVMLDKWREETPFLTSIFSSAYVLPLPGNLTTTLPLEFDSLKKTLEKSFAYQYSGSLTTPPCSEGVTFNVVNEPLLLSARNHAKLKGAVGFNARVIQNQPGQTNLIHLSQAI